MRLASGERDQLAAAWIDERNCLNLLRLVNFRNLYLATGAETQSFALLLCLCVKIFLENFPQNKREFAFFEVLT